MHLMKAEVLKPIFLTTKFKWYLPAAAFHLEKYGIQGHFLNAFYTWWHAQVVVRASAG